MPRRIPATAARGLAILDISPISEGVSRKSSYWSLAAVLLALACQRDPQTTTASPPPASDASPQQSAEVMASSPQRGMRPGCVNRFTSIDANSDGQITQAEFMAAPHRTADPGAVFRARDTDGDGSLTQAEFCSGPRGTQADQPIRDRGPGADQTMGHMGMGRGPGRDMGMGRGRGPGRGMGMHSGMICGVSFSVLDTDGDGKVSQAEISQFHEQRDLDNNGSIEQSELCPALPKAAPAAATSGSANQPVGSSPSK